ncbi:MAG: RluA family pseudouridine synthase [Lachnospiraceae bacterium]|nr:RluA family pseudouridine synthase [Lachnospiraceae bacterium]MDO5549536.1 RluA family pseudouridine synthase [Lachnospiraceae bacterium]
MIRDLAYRISQEEAGLSIEHFLKRRGYSKHIIIQVRNAGGITVDGSHAITPQILKEGETLQIHLEERESSQKVVPTQLPLNLVYEDEDLMIVNKPANMPIHPSQGNFENTLANAVAWYYQQKGQPYVYRAINRLDRDTTGLLILAKHGLSGCILSQMGSRREIRREYLAIAMGKTDSQGRIDAPIGRAGQSTVLRCIDWEHGDPACTHYERLLYREDLDCSLIRLHLETGRTHQIRVHMKHIGHPLPGDFLYNPDYRLMKRQALHSHKLEFLHPITGEAMYFEAPMPEDMKWILES